MVKNTLAKAFQTAAFYYVIRVALHKYVAEAQSVDVVAIRVINAKDLPSPWPFSFKKAEKGSVDNAKAGERFDRSVEAVDKNNMRVKNGISTKMTKPARFSGPPTNIPDYKENQPEGVQYSNLLRAVGCPPLVYLSPEEKGQAPLSSPSSPFPYGPDA